MYNYLAFYRADPQIVRTVSAQFAISPEKLLIIKKSADPMGIERHILSRGQILFQKVLLELWQFIIKLRSHFFHILPTWFLVTHCHHVFPKVALGVQYETDFMCLDIPSSGKEWIGIELESTQKKVITKNGRKTADLEHAIQQIRDWRSWITDNLSYARHNKEQNGLGLIDISPRFFGYVIIGRRKDHNQKFNVLRRQLIRDELITIRSWDGIIEWARKRAKVFSGIPDAFKLIEQQQHLLKETEKLHKLKTLITEIEHIEELLKEKNNTLTTLNERYNAELSKIYANLPEALIENISKLLIKNIPVSEIIKQVRRNIPDNISEELLEDFIVRVMMIKGEATHNKINTADR